MLPCLGFLGFREGFLEGFLGSSEVLLVLLLSADTSTFATARTICCSMSSRLLVFAWRSSGRHKLIGMCGGLLEDLAPVRGRWLGLGLGLGSGLGLGLGLGLGFP